MPLRFGLTQGCSRSGTSAAKQPTSPPPSVSSQSLHPAQCRADIDDVGRGQNPPSLPTASPSHLIQSSSEATPPLQASFVVKATCDSEVRRFRFAQCPTFEEVYDTLWSDSIIGEKRERFTPCYEDDEGDLCTLTRETFSDAVALASITAGLTSSSQPAPLVLRLTLVSSDHRLAKPPGPSRPLALFTGERALHGPSGSESSSGEPYPLTGIQDRDFLVMDSLRSASAIPTQLHTLPAPRQPQVAVPLQRYGKYTTPDVPQQQSARNASPHWHHPHSINCDDPPPSGNGFLSRGHSRISASSSADEGMGLSIGADTASDGDPTFCPRGPRPLFQVLTLLERSKFLSPEMMTSLLLHFLPMLQQRVHKNIVKLNKKTPHICITAHRALSALKREVELLPTREGLSSSEKEDVVALAPFLPTLQELCGTPHDGMGTFLADFLPVLSRRSFSTQTHLILTVAREVVDNVDAFIPSQWKAAPVDDCPDISGGPHHQSSPVPASVLSTVTEHSSEAGDTAHSTYTPSADTSFQRERNLRDDGTGVQDDGNVEKRVESTETAGNTRSHKASPMPRISLIPPPMIHRNACCGGCGKRPIIGPRWKCAVCGPSYDLCGLCYPRRDLWHPPSHAFMCLMKDMKDYVTTPSSPRSISASYGGGAGIPHAHSSRHTAILEAVSNPPPGFEAAVLPPSVPAASPGAPFCMASRAVRIFKRGGGGKIFGRYAPAPNPAAQPASRNIIEHQKSMSNSCHHTNTASTSILHRQTTGSHTYRHTSSQLTSNTGGPYSRATTGLSQCDTSWSRQTTLLGPQGCSGLSNQPIITPINDKARDHAGMSAHGQQSMLPNQSSHGGAAEASAASQLLSQWHLRQREFAECARAPLPLAPPATVPSSSHAAYNLESPPVQESGGAALGNNFFDFLESEPSGGDNGSLRSHGSSSLISGVTPVLSHSQYRQGTQTRSVPQSHGSRS